MEPFKKHHGKLALLDRANIDTDQIIPKQFLKSIARTGFGPSLFYDWRYLPGGKDNLDFPLNKPVFKNAAILVTGNNFGCGSSREHAVWALQQYGFKAIVAPWKKNADGTVIPGFADIFKNNCSKNELLTLEISEAEVHEILLMTDRFPGLEATVDLHEQRLVLHLPEEISFHFEIEPAVKNRLVHGRDDIGTTLQYEAAIRDFESKHNPQLYR